MSRVCPEKGGEGGEGRVYVYVHSWGELGFCRFANGSGRKGKKRKQNSRAGVLADPI